jgi:hypothetical protein
MNTFLKMPPLFDQIRWYVVLIGHPCSSSWFGKGNIIIFSQKSGCIKDVIICRLRITFFFKQRDEQLGVLTGFTRGTTCHGTMRLLRSLFLCQYQTQINQIKSIYWLLQKCYNISLGHIYYV